jgi:hypothetical protein
MIEDKKDKENGVFSAVLIEATWRINKTTGTKQMLFVFYISSRTINQIAKNNAIETVVDIVDPNSNTKL